MVAALAKWTLDDYHRMVDSGVLADRRIELIDGEMMEMPPESPWHRSTCRSNQKYLETCLGDRAVVFSTTPISLPDDSEPEPDLCIAVPPESRYNDRHPHPEDILWLIEVSRSTVSFDLERKAITYARHGILEYWVIDLPAGKLWVHRQPEGHRYQSVQTFVTGPLAPLAFPQIELSVTRLLTRDK